MALGDDLAKLTETVTLLQEKVDRLEKEKATVAELNTLRDDAKGSHDEQSQVIEGLSGNVASLGGEMAQMKALAETGADDIATVRAEQAEMKSEIVELSARPTGGGGFYDEWMLPKEGFPFGLYRELIPGSQYNIVIRYLSAPPIVEANSDAE